MQKYMVITNNVGDYIFIKKVITQKIKHTILDMR
jgi:hypothetical protein